MKKYAFIFLICNLLFISCQKSELEKKLIQEHSVWYIFQYDSITKDYRNLNYAYIFKSNGKCDYVLYDFSENRLSSYLEAMSQDIVVHNNWKYNEKTREISIMYFDYTVEKYTKDTLYLRFKKSDKYDILVNLGLKNPRTLKAVNWKPENKSREK